jgi:CBS domain containing-hemolysin-like protein
MLYLGLAIFLVIVNGFFVAAEFALVKVRDSQLDELVKEGRPFAKTARWLGDRLDSSLSACQLGITMASLALGWVGEPAFANLLEPVFHFVGITSAAALHTTGFIVAFSIITTLHLIVGEQAPKIYAIRRPELMVLWCAVPLRVCYVLFFPVLKALSFTTSKLLQLLGIEGGSEHESPHTEAEIRSLIRHAVDRGELSTSDHRLLHAVFEFDDMICRRVMVPRGETVFLKSTQPLAECWEIVHRTKHTRYPLCDDSLDHILGIIHIKDLIGLPVDAQVDLATLARPLHYVPETMPTSQLLRHFQVTHQLMAIVVDEYGSVVGVVTLENVLEQIIGPVEDEFDTEVPDIAPAGAGQYIVQGSTALALVNTKFGLELDAVDVDTMAGLMLERVGRILAVGDRVEFGDIVAEVVEVDGRRATQIRVTQSSLAPEDKSSAGS